MVFYQPIYHQFSSSIHIRARTTTLSLEEIHNLLICEELALTDDSTDQSQALVTFRPPKPAHGRGSPSARGRGHSPGHSYYPPRHYNNERGLLPLPHSTNKSGTRPQCHICQKIGHLAIDCYHRMDYTYHGQHPPKKLAVVVSSAQPANHTWYFDMGASHHLTRNIDKLQQFAPCEGTDTIQIGNGQGLQISNTGSSIIPTSSSLFFRNILHCPSTETDLLSIHKFSRDNNYAFTFDEFGCCVKDETTGTILYQGPVENGLYPFRVPTVSSTRLQAHFSSSISPIQWHACLGHPSESIQRIAFNILSFRNNKKSAVCSSCQLGKSHRLPFPPSQSSSSQPLELLHCDVWGLVPIPSCSNFIY
ncbi:hypothetical protein NE237_028735 [Protea cynaroides]|uniref:GAG-pre-integrase domain-containing protein n=1 Tax=Protea cynaroides TaxID=273540 RepID=A0A9Q0JVJ9_9MAGN|nr:hypothetical protein NE237_028735 [Protea cynaroides]